MSDAPGLSPTRLLALAVPRGVGFTRLRGLAWIVLPGLAFGFSAAANAVEAEIHVDFHGVGTPIRPEVHGSNHDGQAHRHQNDRWLTQNRGWQAEPASSNAKPGERAAAIGRFHAVSLKRGAFSLVTVPLAGFVAAVAEGAVAENQTAPSPRWIATAARSARSSVPNVEDDRVSTDQRVHHLVGLYGPSSGAPGMKAHSLESEPALWHKAHPRLHPEQVTVEEPLNASHSTAAAIKSIGPTAEVLGPALWGITACASLSKAPDWPAVQKASGHDWFTDASLAEMRQASEAAGMRPLNALDVHRCAESPRGRGFEGLEASRSARALCDASHHRMANQPDRCMGAAFALSENVDAEGRRLGETSVPTEVRGHHEVRAWASRREERSTLHLILLNHSAEQANVRVALPSRARCLRNSKARRVPCISMDGRPDCGPCPVPRACKAARFCFRFLRVPAPASRLRWTFPR